MKLSNFNKLFFIFAFFTYSNICFSQISTSNEELNIETLYDSIIHYQDEKIIKCIDLISQLDIACKNNPNQLCSIDSVEQLKGDVFLDLTRYYQNRDLDSAKTFIQKSFKSYERCNNKIGQMSALFKSGSLNFKDGSYQKSLDVFNSYINFYKKNRNDYKIALGESQRANCYRRMGFQDSAIVISHRAIKTFEKENKYSNIAKNYHTIGLVYAELNQFKSAEEYFRKALNIYENEDNIAGQATIITAMGNNVYFQGDTLGCITYYKKAGKFNIQAYNNEGIYVNYYNIANAFFQLSQYDSSLVYVSKAQQYSDKLGQRHNYMIEYKKGVIFIEIGKIKKGIALLKKSYNSSIELNSYIDARDMAKYLNHGYESLGDYKSALKYANIHSSLKDSVITIESNKEINEIKTKYETEKKETLISHLEKTNSKQRRSIIIGGIGFLLISLLTFSIFLLYNRIKGQKSIISKALKEKDILLREIHHRVKNNLQLISSLLTLQGRSIEDHNAMQAINESNSRVRSMALIHQDLYNKENLTSISVKEYLEKLTLELFQTYQISNDRIKLELDIHDIDLDVDTLVPLGLIINELITNCLKYAFPDNQEGVLFVGFKKIKQKMILNINDNGIGYDPKKINKSSFGSTLLNALTAQLEGKLTVKNINGTSVELQFDELTS